MKFVENSPKLFVYWMVIKKEFYKYSVFSFLSFPAFKIDSLKIIECYHELTLEMEQYEMRGIYS